MSFTHSIAGGQGNLIATSFQSPNFVHDVSGWQVTKAGDAEFNSIVIRGGTVIGGTTLIYNGTPAANNLILSISGTSGKDAEGNWYLPGTTSYGPDTDTGVGYIAQQNNGVLNWYYASAMTGATSPWSLPSAVVEWNQEGLILRSAPVVIETTGSYAEIAGVSYVFPSNDTTGAADWANIHGRLNVGPVVLGQGTFYLSQPVSWANAELSGFGFDTTIQPGSLWSGAALLEPGNNSGIRNITGYGGSNTRSSNPAANFIQTQAGITWWQIQDIRCQYMNGWVISCVPAQGSHGTVRSIKGEHNGGGISINNGTGSAVTTEINVYDVDLQNCETNEILFLSAVTDVLCIGPLNGSVLSGAAVNGVTVQGPCQTCFLGWLDIGGGSGTGVLVFQSTTGGSPSEIEVGPGTVQQGQAGVVVNNASTRLYFHGLWAKANQTDGFQVNGTGAFIVLEGCGGNTNNAAAGTAYDVNVTSTAHVLNQGFRYVSGSVTAGRNLTSAGNHYTEANPPSSLTTAGNAPGGW